jgi:hypothetical protein
MVKDYRDKDAKDIVDGSRGNIPSRFDLSEHIKVSPVRDQGNLPTSVGFAMAGIKATEETSLKEHGMDKMELVFTSFRDSQSISGLRVAIDRHTPKMCSYPTLTYLIVPTMSKSLSPVNMERLCNTVLDNNWELIQDFIVEIYDLGIRQIVFCDWATTEQVAGGKLCMAGVIGRYIKDKADRDGGFPFPIKLEYRDGREVL